MYRLCHRLHTSYSVIRGYIVERSSEQEGRDGQGKNVANTYQPLLVWNYFLTVILRKEMEMGGEQREKALDFTHILL